MTDTNGESHGTVKRERDNLAWAFRWVMGIGLAVIAFIGLEIKSDTKATSAQVNNIDKSVSVMVGDVRRHDNQIEQLQRDLRQVERRQDMRP